MGRADAVIAGKPLSERSAEALESRTAAVRKKNEEVADADVPVGSCR